MKGDDKEAIEAKVTALGEISGKLAERVYKEQAEQGAAEGGAAPEAEAGASADDVVDAEFEEVKDAITSNGCSLLQGCPGIRPRFLQGRIFAILQE